MKLIFILLTTHVNRPFPSSCLPPLQSESKCKVFVMVISSTKYIWMKTNFHNKNFTLRLALKMRQAWTWKWPIKQLSYVNGVSECQKSLSWVMIMRTSCSAFDFVYWQKISRTYGYLWSLIYCLLGVGQYKLVVDYLKILIKYSA